MGIRRIRRAIRLGRYEFTDHALDEMDDDELSEDDVCTVLLRGKVIEELTDDPRGVRFVIYAARRNSVTFRWKRFAGFCRRV